MNRSSKLFQLSAVALFSACAAYAQTWTNNNGSFQFNDALNWSPNSVPSSGANITISSSDFVGMNNGGQFTFGSITVSPSVAAEFVAENAESLLIGSGGVSLGANASLTFSLPVQVSSTATWNVGSGSLVIAAATEITGTINVSVTNGGSVSFLNVGSNNWTGTVNFTTSGTTTINVSNFNSNNIDNITINGSAAQITGGQLQPIPEPATFATLLGFAAVGAFALRRRPRKIAA